MEGLLACFRVSHNDECLANVTEPCLIICMSYTQDEDEDDYSDVSDEEEEEDDEEAGSDDEENDPDFDPATAQKPEECKQQ